MNNKPDYKNLQQMELPEVLHFKTRDDGLENAYLMTNAYVYGTDADESRMYVNVGKLRSVLEQHGCNASAIIRALEQETVGDSNYMFGDSIEFRWSDCNQKYEIVQWLNDAPNHRYCIVLAFFDIDRDEISLRYVGRRPIDVKKESDWEFFNEAVVHGYSYIQAKLDKEGKDE